MTLSDERRARAHFTGWYAATLLATDAAWQALLRDPSASPPPSLRVEVAGVEFQEQDVEAAAAAIHAALRAGLCARGFPAGCLDARLFAVGSTRWLVPSEGRLMPASGPAGALRSEGGVLLVVGQAAGDTLNATGRLLRCALPETVAGLYGFRCPDDRHGRANLDVVAEQASKACGRPALAWEAVVQLCQGPDPAWLVGGDDPVWVCMSEALLRPTGHASVDAALRTRSRSSVRRALQPNKPEGRSRRSSRSVEQELERWLEARLDEDSELRELGKGVEEVRDSGLQAIFKGQSARPPWRRAFARERLAAWAAEADTQASGRKDFGRLAPVLELGPARQPPAPGLPIQDALWALRAVQETFPGRVAAGSAPLAVQRLGLAQVSWEEAGDESLRAVPELEAGQVVLYDAAEEPVVNLRAFGKRLLQQVQEQRESARDTRFFVCFQFASEHYREEAGPLPLEVAFPWRFGRRRIEPDTARRKALDKDRHRFREVIEQLEQVGAAQHPPAGPRLVEALRTLDAAWQGWPGLAGDFAEEAGLHVDLATETLWDGVDALLRAWRHAVECFLELFKDSGNRAARIASGPLHHFLAFATEEATRDERRCLRVFGHHPIRLQRLVALERQAWRDLQRALESPGTLREIPLGAVPQPSGSPAVVWAPWSHGTDSTGFLVPEQDDDPWSQLYVPPVSAGLHDHDLIEPLRPIFDGLARAVFPGMRRRIAAHLHDASRGVRGLRVLSLLADLVTREEHGRVLARGADLRAAPQLNLPATVRELEECSDDRDLDSVAVALSTPRVEDPRFPLEVQAPVERSGSREEARPDAHVALLVRPWAAESRWVVHTRGPEEASASGTSMAWDPASRAWTAPTVAGGAREDQVMERLFQQLLIRRWRGEDDMLPRSLDRSLESHAAHPVGQRLKQVHEACGQRALRTILVDPVVGAEAFDGVDQALQVTLADYHRRTGTRITVLARGQPDEEVEATHRGLVRLYPDADEELGRLAWQATHRTVPSVTRHLWALGAERGELGEVNPDAELIGHLGVCLLCSPVRGPVLAEAWPGELAFLQQPLSDQTILLSMDSLQQWTWTRRSGTRGDFMAVLPCPEDGERAWILAVESKGSAKGSLYDGTRQAGTARSKLEERFSGEDRVEERQELLQCLAQEGFRAKEGGAETLRRVAQGKLAFGAVCVSTAQQGDRLVVGLKNDVLWIRAAGLEGLLSLVGRR